MCLLCCVCLCVCVCVYVCVCVCMYVCVVCVHAHTCARYTKSTAQTNNIACLSELLIDKKDNYYCVIIWSNDLIKVNTYQLIDSFLSHHRFFPFSPSILSFLIINSFFSHHAYLSHTVRKERIDKLMLLSIGRLNKYIFSVLCQVKKFTLTTT